MESEDSAPVWVVGGDLWSTNPRKSIDQDSRDVVETYARCLGAYGEIASMPFAGGVLDQPALIMDAFDVIGPIWRAEVKARREQ